MKIVLAPDSFKDCLSAAEVCLFMERGIRRVLPLAVVNALPLADGGEGTINALVTATGGKTIPISVTGPLGTPVDSRFAVLGDGKTAVVEMAAASGIMLVPEKRRNPLATTTYGTGELIGAALDIKPEKMLVCMGGSATADCGAGMAQALGIRFFKKDGSEIREPLSGKSMGDVEALDVSGLHPGTFVTRIQAACDVLNPLLGPDGAVRVYSRQKGADENQMDLLEKNMERMAGVIEKAAGRSIRGIPGAGAAGGLAVPLIAFAGAELVSGIKVVLDAVRFHERISGADLIFTGEGKIDGQTLRGKTVFGVAREAQKQGIPVFALAGLIEKGAGFLLDAGVSSMVPVCPETMPRDQCIQNAGKWISDAAERVIKLFVSKRPFHDGN
jgi:glycerate kinase